MGVATFLATPPPPPQINHGRDTVAPNLLRFLSRGTLVTGSVGEPVCSRLSIARLVACACADGARQPDPQDRGDGTIRRRLAAVERVNQNGLLAIQLREICLRPSSFGMSLAASRRGGIRVQVVLVVVLGGEEARGPVGACDHWCVEDLRLVELVRCRRRRTPLLNVVLGKIADRYCSPTSGPCPVQLRRVVYDGEEDVE